MATNEEFKKRIEVMQAYIDGREIEYKDYGEVEWQSISAPHFDSYQHGEYRIKPKPREVWIRDGSLFYSQEEAMKYGNKATKYREVMEDE